METQRMISLVLRFLFQAMDLVLPWARQAAAEQGESAYLNIIRTGSHQYGLQSVTILVVNPVLIPAQLFRLPAAARACRLVVLTLSEFMIWTKLAASGSNEAPIFKVNKSTLLTPQSRFRRTAVAWRSVRPATQANTLDRVKCRCFVLPAIHSSGLWEMNAHLVLLDRQIRPATILADPTRHVSRRTLATPLRPQRTEARATAPTHLSAPPVRSERTPARTQRICVRRAPLGRLVTTPGRRVTRRALRALPIRTVQLQERLCPRRVQQELGRSGRRT